MPPEKPSRLGSGLFSDWDQRSSWLGNSISEKYVLREANETVGVHARTRVRWEVIVSEDEKLKR